MQILEAPTPAVAVGALVGRADARSAIEGGFAALCHGLGTCLLFSAPPGAGTTTIVDMVRAHALSLGIPVADLSATAWDLAAPKVLIAERITEKGERFERELLARARPLCAFPILLVATHAVTRAIDRARYTAAGFGVVDVAPMADDEIVMIVRDRVPEIKDADVGRIVRAAAGSPRYALELARERAASVPPSISRALERFGSEHGREMLRALSVLAVSAVTDERVDLELAGRLDGGVPMQRLEHAALLANIAEFLDIGGRFVHPLVRRAAASLLGMEVGQLHVRAGETLAREAPDPDRFVAIAAHYLAAGRIDAAAEQYRAAAAGRAVAGEHREAAQLYRRVLALASLPPSARAATQADLARTLVAAADLAGAVAHFRAALEEYRTLGEPGMCATVAAETAKTQTRILDFSGALATCSQALNELHRSPLDGPHATLLVVSATIALAEQNEPRIRAIFASIDAVRDEMPASMRWDVARLCGLFALLYPSTETHWSGPGMRAVREFRLAIALAEHAGDLSGVCASYVYLGYAQLLKGELADAQASMQRALEFACRARDESKIVLAYSSIMQLASLSGEMQRVLTLTELMERSAPGGRVFCEEHVTISVARAALLLRDPRGPALDDARRVYERLQKTDDYTGLVNAASTYCLCAEDAHRPSIIGSTVDDVIPRLRRLIPETPELLFFAASHGAPATVERARALLAQARSMMAEPLWEGLTELFAALELRRAGRARAARRPAMAAERRFANVGWQLFQARALRAADRNAQASMVEARMGARNDVTVVRSPLSPRENTIAALAAAGRANASIARELGISERTIQVHMAAILRKLQIKSRHQIGALIARQAVDDTRSAGC